VKPVPPESSGHRDDLAEVAYVLTAWVEAHDRRMHALLLERAGAEAQVIARVLAPVP